MPLKSRYNTSFTGNVTYGRNVLSSIITLAIQEITGVSSISGKGVKINVIGKTVGLDVYINVNFGVSCSDVAFRVQENVKRSVESMTEYKVGDVNVHVVGITVSEV